MAASVRLWQLLRQPRGFFSKPRITLHKFYFFNTTVMATVFQSIRNQRCRAFRPTASGKWKLHDSLLPTMGTTLAFLGIFGKKKESQEKENIQMLVRGGIKAMNDGDLVLADKIFHKTLEVVDQYRRTEKLTSEDVLNSNTFVYSYLANIAFAQQQFESAEKLYKETMKGFIQLGMEQNHNAIVEVSIKLAGIYAATGRDVEAREGYKFCIETQEKKLAENPDADKDTLAFLGIALESYGRYLMACREFVKAEPLVVHSAAVAKEVYGEDDSQTLNLLNDVATVKISLFKYAEAEEILKKAITTAQRIHSPMIPVLFCNMGALYLRQSELLMAKAACEKAFAVASQRKDNISLARSKSCLKKVQEKMEKQQTEAKKQSS